MNTTAVEPSSLAGVDYDPFAQPALQRVVPVTEPQREVWLADKLGDDGSLAYNESISLRLRGPLDVDALCVAVHELGERHESLRATISPNGDELCIAERIDLDTVRHDFSAMAPTPREQAVAGFLRAAVESPFDLERGPLVRAALLKRADDDHQFVLTAHHIICDGWSFGVLVRDIAAAYSRLVGAPGALDDAMPAQSFAQYAASQAAWAESAQCHEDERYWLSRFDGAVPVLDLPLDGPRPRQRTFAAGREDVMLDAELVAALRKLGAVRGASLFTTLFTGFSTLMRRLSGQTDVVVGIAAAGQSMEGHDSLVGHCINILPVRSDIAPGTGFAAALNATGNLLLDAFEHQQYTFGTLLRKLAIARDPGRLPLVSVLFNLDQPLDASTVHFPGLEFECSANARSYENFELFVNAVPVAGGLRLECQYNRDLHHAASIRRWMQAFDTLLHSAVSEPDAAWDRLGWVSPQELQALEDLQPAPTAFDAQLLVHQRFVAHAGATPEHVALAFGSQEISYAELDRRSNAVARALRARGVSRGALVGMCLMRDPELVVALLGILKSGAAFVPLDPTYPKDRLNFMIADAGMAAVVTTSALLGTLDTPREQLLVLDADLDAEAWSRTAPLPHDELAATSDSPAYVIYTSGSTGKPKGVVVPHRSVVNLLGSMQHTPGLGADDRLVAVTTISFDISILELFLPLYVGARIILASSDDSRDGLALRRLLEGSGATVMQATPSGWRVLLDSDWNGGGSFKALVGGESLPQALAVELRERCGELWNMYGPTETTVWSTCARVDSVEKGISIGTPIANTTVWVLDEHQAPCPMGVPGELWIGGAGVTLGYLHRPELTAERFVEDPRARMYRTGDRGRWRNDETLEHMGRFDFQVKVRGHRIELGEIESNLVGHPDVDHCVVIAREDRPGDVRLVAYVVLRAGADDVAPVARKQALLEQLRATLPGYMVPPHLVFIDAVPLLPNGKLDRNALRAPDLEGPRTAERITPRTETERAVAAIMEQVLALPDIGVDDDFFALGGHSLLAAQLTSRLNRELGASLSMRALFDAPTVARLAALLESPSQAPAPAAAAIERRPDQRLAPLSLMQERLRLLEEFNPGQISYNTPSAHRLSGPLVVPLLDRSLRDLAQRQTVLRTSIGTVDGTPMQIVHSDIATGIEHVEDLSALADDVREKELKARLRALVEVPFDDFGRAPLFRARLFRMGPEEHVLFFMPHHIIWDGWSFDLLYAQLSEIYAAYVEGRSPAVPELPVTYGDYAAWHREWVHGPEYARQLGFWRERLGGGDGQRLGRARAMPTDMPRRAGMSGQGTSQAITVPKALCLALHDAGLRMDATLFVTLLSAYYALMSRMTGQCEQIIGTPVRGRNSAQVEDLMGYFTNLLPLYVEIDPERSFSDTVKQVKAMVLDSFANPDIRLEDLMRELSLRSEGGGAVLYQSLFSFQDVRQRNKQWGPLRHERVEVFRPAATEDLGIWLVEAEEGLSGGLIYNASLFHDDTISLLRERYLEVLRRVASDWSQSIVALTRFDDGRPAVIGDGARPGGAGAEVEDLPISTAPRDIIVEREPPKIDDPRVRYLIDLWSEVLGVPAGPDDNFFDLGGNSMLGVEMAERVARDTGVPLKLVRLASQSLEEIAAALPQDVGNAGSPGLSLKLVRNMKRLFGRPPGPQ